MFLSTHHIILFSYLFDVVNGWLLPSPKLTDKVLSGGPKEVFPVMEKLVTLNPRSIRISMSDLCGAWQVVCTKQGPKGEPNWVAYSNILGRFYKDNNNYQIFTSDGCFVNLSEYFSNKFFAIASGTYTLNPPGTIPQVAAEVNNVKLCFGSPHISLSLGVKGTGFVTIRHLDTKQGFRIFENEDGAQVLQRRVTVPPQYESLLNR